MKNRTHVATKSALLFARPVGKLRSAAFVFLILVPKWATAQEERSVVPQPVAASFAPASPDPIMVGQPIVLRWTIRDTVRRNTTVQEYKDQESWLQSITLTDESGREVPVSNLSFPLRTEYSYDEGCRVDAGSAQTDCVVFQPAWAQNATPGDYVLKLHVRLPYVSRSTDMTEAKNGIVQQDISLPLQIVAVSHPAMHEIAESLSQALYIHDYKGTYTSDIAITALFAMPQEDADDVWRKVLFSATPPDPSPGRYLINAVCHVATRRMANLCAQMYDLAKKSNDTDGWRAKFGPFVLGRMYLAADAGTRFRIVKLLTQINGKAPDKGKLERGIPQ